MNSGILYSLTHAGVFANTINIVLLFASIYVWALAWHKFRQFKVIESKNKKFLEMFRERRHDLFGLYNELRVKKTGFIPFYNIFREGCLELARVMKKGKEGPGSLAFEITEEKLSFGELEDVDRSLERVVSEQVAVIENAMVYLGTAVGISPLMGLFGTVYGIMDCFQSMSAQGSANIATVAPGISAALTTTFMGLFVAIPALAIYNLLRNRISVITESMDNFSGEFISAVALKYLKG